MTGSEIALGPARRSDAFDIAAMSRSLIEQGLPWSWTPERVTKSLRRPDALVVVARARERIVGFGIMRYGDDEAHLDLLGVHPDFRGEGVGRRLVEWLEQPASLAGIALVSLEVRESNRTARAFYERLGYRVRERLEHYYQRRESAIRMEHALGGAESSARLLLTNPPRLE